MDNPIRLLMLAIVQEQDLDVATRAVGSFGAPVVYLASAGGFLGRRNATILIGLPKGRKKMCYANYAKPADSASNIYPCRWKVRLCPCRRRFQ